MANDPLQILPKDYLETWNGLLFAVLSARRESGKIPAYLRYRRNPEGSLRKLETQEAKRLLERDFPGYLFASETTGLTLQGVAPEDILKHHSATLATQNLMERESRDPVLMAAKHLIQSVEAFGMERSGIGVTGSILIGAQSENSDIDLLVRSPEDFERLRCAIRFGIEAGVIESLGEADWRKAFARRKSPLSFDEFVFHEARKDNKGMIDGIKFDLTLSEAFPEVLSGVRRQLGPMRLEAVVTGDEAAFGFPARYAVAHPQVSEVVVFSQSYVGQARTTERIEAWGDLEETLEGRYRLVVGRDREASGHSLRVLPETWS